VQPSIDIEKLAAQLVAAAPALDATEQAIAVAVTRMLADGSPVPARQVAESLGIAEDLVDERFARWPGVFRDDGDNVIGFMGLTIIEMGTHRLHIDGREVSAWCAWDTLFLPEILDATVAVTSRCPVTAREITLTVTPDGVCALHPHEAVVSFLVPETPFDSSVVQSFCHFIHFFASAGAGEAWTAEHPGTFLMSVDDAHRLGRLTNAARLGAVLRTRA
jgi:alkylmercury lyase